MVEQIVLKDINKNWLFNLGDIENSESINLDDSKWRQLNIPHDWSVEFSFNEKEGEGCTGYLLGGIGWYRKHFKTPDDKGTTYLCFDGIYNNAEIFINGTLISKHPYGYSPFYYDISSYLNATGYDNVIAVRVDRTRYADSRWYTGSGIYRNVKLIVVDKLHIPVWGTFLTTPHINESIAEVNIAVTVKNEHKEKKAFTLSTRILCPSGTEVHKQNTECLINEKEKQVITQALKVDNPKLWDIENPKMYTAITSITCQGQVIQEYTTPFGIRSFRFDSDTGFCLNGESLLIKGVCLHHDAGLVGAAVPIDVWRRRLKKLKACGCNAIRTAHNPSSEEFLDLCDEMGFLVQVEFFDEWYNPKDKRKNGNEQTVDYITRSYTEHFHEWAERDIKSTMLRDRNHPCVFQWSIGNEIEWTYPTVQEATGYFDAEASGNYFFSPPPSTPEIIRQRFKELPDEVHGIGKTAKKLAEWTREMDITRPVIANCIFPSGSYESGYTDALDIVGYSYRQVVYDYGHKHYPDKPIMGTENLGQWHEWKHVIERDFIPGLFIWTGIDHLGETVGSNAHNKEWPQKGSTCGMLDLAGFEKPSYHMYKSLWTEQPHVYLATQELEASLYNIDGEGRIVEKTPDQWKEFLWFWQDVNHHWNYESQKPIIVEVYSNCETVELFLNSKSLGVKKISDFEDRIYKWLVPFSAGKLTAKGEKACKLVSAELITASEANCISLCIDKTQVYANCKDIIHVEAQIVDKHGVFVQTTESEIHFHVEGACRILGVDNGMSDSVQDYQTTKVITSKGRCLLIAQATDVEGIIKISATTSAIKSNAVEVEVLLNK